MIGRRLSRKRSKEGKRRRGCENSRRKEKGLRRRRLLGMLSCFNRGMCQ